jgi:hypothetical protein
MLTVKLSLCAVSTQTLQPLTGQITITPEDAVITYLVFSRRMSAMGRVPRVTSRTYRPTEGAIPGDQLLARARP